MLDKTYQPGTVETRLYEEWEALGAFHAGDTGDKQPYAVMMPPPNVTGSLHIGHALTFTIQDILIRYQRLRGRDALWQPGTDHAGIATQMVVERQLEAAGKSRHDLGREAFIEKVWEWKAESGGTITRQLRRLGASPDWVRERFTMDEGLSHAVRTVFVALHAKGLIYRDKRLVNWDPKLHTAISDLEVESREVKSSLWYLRYPIEGMPGRFITVATTRPETMLGDTGVAVHPEDERYADLIGCRVLLPLVGRSIPIVADSYSDPTKGSGAVKITPAHDFNDFEVGKRHGLEVINIFDRDAHLVDDVPEPYRGMERYAAREKIVADLAALELVEKIEPHVNTVPYGDRSGVVIEPWLTDQWYCNAKILAEPAIRAVEDGRMKFVPKQWDATFYEWMRNIQPWCISRQIWWGHQIPAWFGPDGVPFVAMDETGAAELAAKHYGKAVDLVRDGDVLDTWFSSALWPFSTLGWPEKTPALERYYPTDVLVTGFDIIFFWVARMMMMGMEFMGDVPFKTIYIHALVRDAKGQKMSKSKGNVIDPLDLVDRFGCDALRFTLAALAVPGRDVKLAEARVEGYRNFVTKLWNAARFLEMNGCGRIETFDPTKVTETVNRWIVSEVATVGDSVAQAIETYRFHDAAGGLYQFAWGSFCDWYLEFIKPVLLGPASPAQAEVKATAAWVFEQILRLANPLMPFVTEELAIQLGFTTKANPLIKSQWPEYSSSLASPDAAAEMDWVVRLISGIRGARAEMNVPPGAQLKLLLLGLGERGQGWLETHRPAIERMARVTPIELVASAPGAGFIQIVQDEATLFLDVADAIDIPAERKRLAKDVERLKGERAKHDAKLNNPAFREKADPAVVEEITERRTDATAAIEKLEAALTRLA